MRPNRFSNICRSLLLLFVNATRSIGFSENRFLDSESVFGSQIGTAKYLLYRTTKVYWSTHRVDTMLLSILKPQCSCIFITKFHDLLFN